uniref:Uncharacterized protein n=1 Tax=Solanum lycopersicum TaxID=4081 RepID=K4DFP5_SOLLC
MVVKLLFLPPFPFLGKSRIKLVFLCSLCLRFYCFIEDQLMLGLFLWIWRRWVSGDCFQCTLRPGIEEREDHLGSNSVREGGFRKFWGLKWGKEEFDEVANLLPWDSFDMDSSNKRMVFSHH